MRFWHRLNNNINIIKSMVYDFLVFPLTILAQLLYIKVTLNRWYRFCKLHYFLPPIFIYFAARVWELFKAEEKFCVAMSYIRNAMSFMWSLTSFLWKKNVRCSTENHFSQNFLHSPEIIRWSTETKHKEKRIIWK